MITDLSKKKLLESFRENKLKQGGMVKNSGYIGENRVRMVKNGAFPPIARNHIPLTPNY